MNKAQIISKNKIDKLIEGTPCYLVRTNTLVIINDDNSRTYITRTDRVIKTTNMEPVFDSNGQPVLTPSGAQKKKAVTILEFVEQKDKSSELKLAPTDVINLGAFLSTNMPANLNEVEQDLYKRAAALQMKSIQDIDLPNGYMGTNLWDILQ